MDYRACFSVAKRSSFMCHWVLVHNIFRKFVHSCSLIVEKSKSMQFNTISSSLQLKPAPVPSSMRITMTDRLHSSTDTVTTNTHHSRSGNMSSVCPKKPIRSMEQHPSSVCAASNARPHRRPSPELVQHLGGGRSVYGSGSPSQCPLWMLHLHSTVNSEYSNSGPG